MHYLKVASILASATLASATNYVTFVSTDDVDRTVYWTGNAGMPTVDDTVVAAGENVTVEVPDSWVGNYYSVSEGADNTPGMLGEVSFQSWNGLTFFDVSAIVDAADHNGVSMMYPADEPYTPTSGCRKFPCNNAYYLADDVQTKSTLSTHIITTLGTTSVASRGMIDVEERDDGSESFPRDAVTTPMWRPKRK